MRALVIGATGVVGTAVGERLRRDGFDVTAVSRRGRGADVIAWPIGMVDPPGALRDGAWDVIVNCAASTKWNLPEAAAWRANVASVSALRPLVAERTHVIHLSTAFATGRTGTTTSASVADYRNTYEWSKAGSERAAVEAFPRCTIIRPPLIVGDSRTGAIARFSGLYQLMKAATLGLLPLIVGDAGAHPEIVPVDLVADETARAAAAGPAAKPGAGPRIRVLGAAHHALSLRDLIGLTVSVINDWRCHRGVPPVQSPTLVTDEQWKRFYAPFTADVLSARQLDVIEKLSAFTAYLSFTASHRVDRVTTDLDPVIRHSVWYWCERFPAVASAEPRPWRREPAVASARA